MPKNLGLYNNSLSVPRKQDIDAVAITVEKHDGDIQQLETGVSSLNTEVSAVQTALTSKQNTITGAGSTITNNNLTANRVVVSNESGKVATSDITTTELNYIDGVTSNVQTQLDSKVTKATTVNGHALSGNVAVTKGDIGLNNVDNVKQYSASNPPPYPVTSVDGSTGTVVLSDIKYISQTLTDAQKTQARENIGAGTSSFSGNYNDLSNKPTIPTVNNGTLTIQRNGDNVATFGANNSANITANIAVPTNTSQLTNGAGFITASGAPVQSVNGKTGNVTLTATNVGALPISGGTLTGNLTGLYLTGTWLQTTNVAEQSSATTKIAVIDNNGWIYYRTPINLRNDLGAAQIIAQSAQPTGQNSGDFWYQVTG